MTDQILDELTEDAKEYNPAGFWIRVLASFLDFIALLVPLLILLFLSLTATLVQQFSNLFAFLLSASYYIYMTHKHRGTFGKLLLNLQVLSKDGQPLTLNQSMLRFLVTWAPSMLIIIVVQLLTKTFGYGVFNSVINPIRQVLNGIDTI